MRGNKLYPFVYLIAFVRAVVRAKFSSQLSWSKIEIELTRRGVGDGGGYENV